VKKSGPATAGPRKNCIRGGGVVKGKRKNTKNRKHLGNPSVGRGQPEKGRQETTKEPAGGSGVGNILGGGGNGAQGRRGTAEGK